MKTRYEAMIEECDKIKQEFLNIPFNSCSDEFRNINNIKKALSNVQSAILMMGVLSNMKYAKVNFKKDIKDNFETIQIYPQIERGIGVINIIISAPLSELKFLESDKNKSIESLLMARLKKDDTELTKAYRFWTEAVKE